ncbi:hypothetical protein ACLB2K_012138 [Fragaria x ananassa]
MFMTNLVFKTFYQLEFDTGRDLQRISGNNTYKVGHSSMEEIKHRGSNYQSAKFQNANIPTIEEALKVGFIVMIDQSTGVRTNLLRMRDARFVGMFHPLIDEKLHRSSYIIIDLSRRVCLGIICGAYSSKKSNQSFFALRITLVQFIYLFTISRGVHVVESISLLCEVGVFALYISINGSNPIKAITRMISSNSSAAATYCPGRRQRLFVIAVDCYDQNGNGTQTFQEIISSVKKATSLGFGQGRVGFVLLTGSSLQETLKAFKGCQVSIEEFDANNYCF